MILPRISSDRLWSRLMDMARIGARPDGGVNRQALSSEDRDAIARMIDWGRPLGLRPALDQAGNLFLTLPGQDRAAAPVLIGSHLDSQPNGGRFDGVMGVLAALEVVETLATAGLIPPRDITVVAWMNEEGGRFAPGMMGSEVFAGSRSLDDIRAVCDAHGMSVADALDALFAAFPDLPPHAPGGPVHAYIEPHIEQASHLERTGHVIGAVTGIQGKKTLEIRIEGKAAHAGTEPMDTRRDALQAFARIATALQGHMSSAGPDVRFTIGRLDLSPNAPSVVPERATFRIDLRHPDNEVLNALGAAIPDIAIAEAAPCIVGIIPMVDAPANTFDPALRAAIRASAAAHELPATDVLSAAGHDARFLARIAPAAMIFIPCRDGLSHHPDEWAEPSHVAAAAQVLLETAWMAATTEFAQGPQA